MAFAPARVVLPALVLIAAVFAADQVSKWWIMEKVLLPQGATALGFWDWMWAARPMASFLQGAPFGAVTLTSWLNLVMVWNQGVSFGLFDSADPRAPLVLAGIAGAVALGLTVWLFQARRGLLSTALALVIGGALGNVVDRFRFGAVADFIDAHAGGLHWPAFNVADACIVAGAFLLALDAFLSDRPQSGGLKK